MHSRDIKGRHGMRFRPSLAFAAFLSSRSIMKEISLPSSCSNLQVHSISDIHVDYKKNLDWFRHWCESLKASKGSAYSVLLIPGDIASNPQTFCTALEVASECFDSTFICAGNHDLWYSSSLMEEGVNDSLDKLQYLHKIAAELGIHTRPAYMTSPSGRRLFVVPILSWYHPSWDKEPDLPPEIVAALHDGRPPFEKRWADFRFCKWPEAVISGEHFRSTTTESTALADHFAEMNTEALGDEALALEARKDTDVIISFSHFLPRQELCPEKRFLIEPGLTKVIGSDPLGRQVQALRPDLHIFGHTHIPLDLTVEGIRYLQWPLGSVGEQRRQCAEMSRQGPTLIYDDSRQGLQGTIATKWGEHYRQEKRDVLRVDLAPWVVDYAQACSASSSSSSSAAEKGGKEGGGARRGKSSSI